MGIDSPGENGIANEGGQVTVRNSIVADGGRFTSQGFNLILGQYFIVGGPTTGDILGVDPKLGPLGWNGGPTQTHALLPGSPAINAGNNAGAVDASNNPLPFDQRGGVNYPRIRGGAVDIGAVEAPDDDGDAVLNEIDNCPAAHNVSQLNTDGDPQGDVCDADDDNDEVPDAQDAFPLNPDESVDTDGDGIGNNADPDDGNDDVFDTADNCTVIANRDQADFDHDGIGNVCDATPGNAIDIVFVSTRDSASWWSLNLEIYGMRADGTGVVRLTSHPAVDLAPALSPDKRRILFTSTRDNNRTEIFVMNTDGGNVQRLTTSSAIEGTAVWSPDGTRIAFTSTRDGNAELYVMNADGSHVVRLTRDSTKDVNPAWSPDGNRIAFASNRSGNFDIYTMKPDGKDVRRVTTHKQDDAFPSWSPDGAKIAFTSTRDANAEIYVMNAANSGGVMRLTNNRAIDAEPVWGAGNRILFTSTRGGRVPIIEPSRL